MAKKKISIIWSSDASSHLLEILEYLHAESETAANIVAGTLFQTIEKLPAQPLSHPKDRFRKNNKGECRACIVYSYRISYLVSENEIIILRIRHTSREPLEF